MEKYKQNIIDALGYLSSREWQQRAWIEDNDIWSSFQDEVETIFFDYGTTESIIAGEIVFSKEADAALLALEKACDKIGYDHDAKELIDAPEMEALRQQAAKALALVLAADGSESTVEVIDYS